MSYQDPPLLPRDLVPTDSAMSYCRWSSDNWQCDLHCYADVNGGYTTYVASNRVVGKVPVIDWNAGPEIVVAQQKRQYSFLLECERVSIDLPHAGETLRDATLSAFRHRLLELRLLGYRFPDCVLERVNSQVADERLHAEERIHGLL